MRAAPRRELRSASSGSRPARSPARSAPTYQITYHFIEPLWAEMMAEHGEARTNVASERGRGGLLWALTERALRA